MPTVLHNIDNASCCFMFLPLQVKYALFRKIFLEEYNIGFGNPATDTCAYCDRVKDAIKQERMKKNFDEVRKLKREFRGHRDKARAYFTNMKASPANSVTLCFDLQQVKCAVLKSSQFTKILLTECLDLFSRSITCQRLSSAMRFTVGSCRITYSVSLT